MLSDEQREKVKAMVAAMRSEGAKFPVRYVSPLETRYGAGPMATLLGGTELYGVCGCLQYWSKRLFFTGMVDLGVADEYCAVSKWPTPWRRRYQSVKTVRAQYRVMADFVEAEVLNK